MREEWMDVLPEDLQNIKLEQYFEEGNFHSLSICPKSSFDLYEKCFSFSVTNYEKCTHQLCIRFDSGSRNNVKKNQVFSATIAPGASQRVYVPLGSLQVNLGMLGNPPGEYTIASYIWGGVEPVDYKNIKEISFSIDENTSKVHMSFWDMKVEDTLPVNYKKDFSNLVDEYGQLTGRTWQGKVRNNQDFIEDKTLETEELSSYKEKRSLTKYFGNKKEELKEEATGHFYVKKVNHQWKIIDPLGYPYFASGVDIVRIGDSATKTENRAYMFQGIPEDSLDPIDFYVENLKKKYGDDWYKEWVNTSISRFKAWGFTSLGCWCNPETFYGKGEKFQFPMLPMSGFIDHKARSIVEDHGPIFQILLTQDL